MWMDHRRMERLVLVWCSEIQNSQFIAGLARGAGACSNNVAEWKAMKAALEYIVAEGWENVIIESDSSLVINSLANQRNASWQFETLFCDCKYLASICKPSFKLVPRQCNSLADYLAKSGCNKAQNEDWGSITNPQMNSILAFDASGTLFPRAVQM
ncbi:hypothetical protein ACHQM5_010641 [Ranunculus cassubicifolius]